MLEWKRLCPKERDVHGERRSRYIGLAKTHLQHILIATALNLVRLEAWLNDVPIAKTRISRFKKLQPKPA